MSLPPDLLPRMAHTLLFIGFMFLVFCGVAVLMIGITGRPTFPSSALHFVVTGVYWGITAVLAFKIY